MGKAGKQKAAPSASYGAGFLPLPIQAESSSALHFLYVKAQAERELFVSNLPVDFDESSARSVFSRFGVIEGIEFGKGSGRSAMEAAVLELSDDEASDEEEEEEPEAPAQDDGWTFVGTEQPKRRRRRRLQEIPASVPEVLSLVEEPVQSLHHSGSATCTVTFLDAVSVSRATKPQSTPIRYKSTPTGLSRYIAQYAALRPKLTAVKAHADSAMARYDHLHSLLLTSRAKAHGAGALVDADGFTVVVRGGRYGRTAGRGADGAGVAVASFADENKKKKKARGAAELKDFYRFQAQDRKKKELAEMRAKFEHDKQRVADLKKNRRYKPY